MHSDLAYLLNTNPPELNWMTVTCLQLGPSALYCNLKECRQLQSPSFTSAYKKIHVPN